MIARCITLGEIAFYAHIGRGWVYNSFQLIAAGLRIYAFCNICCLNIRIDLKKEIIQVLY